MKHRPHDDINPIGSLLNIAAGICLVTRLAPIAIIAIIVIIRIRRNRHRRNHH